MLSHVTIGTNDFAPAFDFYSKVLTEAGLMLKFAQPEQQLAAWRPPGRKRPLFLLTRPYDGGRAHAGNGPMLAFAAESRQRVDQCHAAALRAGGLDEGRPGPRPEYHSHY